MTCCRAEGIEGGNMEHFEVVVVGSGFGGLLSALSIKEDAGVHDICIFEKSSAVGGVWSKGGVGAYPGAACDVSAYTYLPLLDRTGFVPSKKYVTQPEISGYVETLAKTTGVKDFIRFNRVVTSVSLLPNKSSYPLWSVQTCNAQTGLPGETVTCHHIVLANGPISNPRMPDVPGVDCFKGASYHTARWPENVALEGKRVAVVGTGASAAQVITEIAEKVEHLYVFQRTPTWCMPRDDMPTPAPLREAFEARNGFGELLRREQAMSMPGRNPQNPSKHMKPLSVFQNGLWEALHNPNNNRKVCALLEKLIQAEVPDPDLARRLTPDYPFWCKRALFIDGYYGTFNRSNVTLKDDGGGVAEILEDGIRTASGESVLGLDVIIYATGFDTMSMSFTVAGRNSEDLATKFGADASNRQQMIRPKTLWGMHVEGFPNLYMVCGPQSLNPVTNVTLLEEMQAKHIGGLIKRMKQEGIHSVEPRAHAVSAWTSLCDAAMDGKVWLSCNNWYTKSTKEDTNAGREQSAGMWMGQYEEYIAYLNEGKGGSLDQLLHFSK